MRHLVNLSTLYPRRICLVKFAIVTMPYQPKIYNSHLDLRRIILIYEPIIAQATSIIKCFTKYKHASRIVFCSVVTYLFVVDDST